MGKRFSANGDYVDFASLELGILGLTRLPNELSAVNFGDSISRADIEGTGQVPLGQARGTSATTSRSNAHWKLPRKFTTS